MKTTKKFLAIILAFMMVLSIVPITASAAVTSGTCGDNLTWNFDASTGTLTISGTGAMYDYPYDSPWESIDNKIKAVVVEDGVTTIGNGAFYDYYWLVKVTFSDSVTTIGRLAFAYCDGLTDVTFGNGLKTIDYGAFYKCEKLKKAELPDGVTTIGESAFEYCEQLESVNIPYGVEKIGNYAFFVCEKLTNVTIPNSVTEIGEYAFADCESLTEIIIPDSVTLIGNDAFGCCKNLESISIGSCVKTIGNFAFTACTKLTEVYIPESVEQIGISVFSRCDNLTKITVDEKNSFYSNDEHGVLFNKDKTVLMQYPCGRTETSYVIPDGVTTIEYTALCECNNLKDITIPASVSTIDEFAFDDFTVIFHYGGTEAQWKQLLADNSEAAERLINFTVHCSDNSVYPSGACGENLTWMLDITTGTLTISGTGYMDNYERCTVHGDCDHPWAVFNYQYIKNVVINDGVLSIGTDAFDYCCNLESVTIANTVSLIDCGAFSSCDKLTDVYYFGTQAEWNAIQVENENSDLLTANIHYQMQEDVLVSGVCGDNLTWTLNTNTGNLIISGKGEMYDNPTWDGYKNNITNVIIEQSDKPSFIISGIPIIYGVSSIGENAFSGCENLRNISIPDSVTTIGAGAFDGCKRLERVVIPDSVTVLGGNAFNDCINLEKVVLGSGITTIEDGTFYNCASLKEVTMTVNVTAIDFAAFYSCGELKDIYYTGSEEDWNKITIGSFNTRLNKATIHYAYLECKHEYNKYEVLPTCTEQGYTWYCCSICGDRYSENYVAPLGHNYDSFVKVEPTCTSLGIITYTCTVCNEAVKREYYGEALGHSYETVVTEPTCTEQGYTTYTCTVCDYSTVDDYTEATGHTVDSWEVVAKPTCIKVGTEKGLCSICGQETTQTIKSLGHEFGELQVDYEATCTKDGRKSKQCSRCGDRTAIEIIPAPGHSYGEWEQVDDAKCGEYGRFERYCSTCGNIKAMSAPTEHDYSIEQNVVEATCTTVGSKKLECSDCGKTVTETIPATGHEYKSEITTPATHFTTGVETFICDCGDTYTEVIEKIGDHTYETVVTAPTCTERGYTTYTCECGDSYVDDYVNATGHDYKSEITISATHMTEGLETFTCTCGDAYTKVIEKIADHTYEIVVTAPTCTEQGYTTCTCECGNSYVVDYIDATGHTPADAVEENFVASTCTENGSKDVVVYCSVCNEEISRETVTIDATGHADNDSNGYCDADNELLDPTVECDCNCHKSGISNFFFRFILFFQRIFGANKTCDCNVAHY